MNDFTRYSAWIDGTSLAIGLPGSHWNDADVSVFGGDAARHWADDATKNGTLVELDDEGFFPSDLPC